MPVQVEIPHNDDEVVRCEEHGVQGQLISRGHTSLSRILDPTLQISGS